MLDLPVVCLSLSWIFQVLFLSPEVFSWLHTSRSFWCSYGRNNSMAYVMIITFCKHFTVLQLTFLLPPCMWDIAYSIRPQRDYWLLFLFFEACSCQKYPQHKGLWKNCFKISLFGISILKEKGSIELTNKTNTET